MINSPFLNSQSRLFAASLQNEVGNDNGVLVSLALRRVMQRTPTDAEVERGLLFIESMKNEHKLSAQEAIERFCLLVFNLNEFVFVN